MKNPFTMRDRLRGYLSLPVLIMFSLLFMSGCAALEKKFTPGESADSSNHWQVPLGLKPGRIKSTGN